MKDKIIELRNMPNIFVTKQEAAERIGVEPRTIQNWMNEIEQYPDRYGTRTTSRDHGYSLINILVLYDYLHYRKQLKQKNLRKMVPPYNPDEWIHELGWDRLMEA